MAKERVVPIDETQILVTSTKVLDPPLLYSIVLNNNFDTWFEVKIFN